ncbi:SRPBCC family protein [Nocardia sp. CDC153]|uniref:SRPBCC family protein n=1 Tax=Nocardia sp. CDC153 TaxID=3112167 RepID=UPI002DBA38DF|nr:SRPBCC family protein [Nocardia sp. CDC153]MEC3956998.1 SRPBCC family protein [Nocardia sp. CDC153]
MPAHFEISERALIPAPVERVWEVVSNTARYAEWVAAVLEVTDHHGPAELGKTYSERNRTLGPLTTRSTWTVHEIKPLRRRVDTGTGFEPLRKMTNIFEFRPLDTETEMTYTVHYQITPAPLAHLLHRIVQPSTRQGMQTSMSNLTDLLIAEG